MESGDDGIPCNGGGINEHPFGVVTLIEYCEWSVCVAFLQGEREKHKATQGKRDRRGAKEGKGGRHLAA